MRFLPLVLVLVGGVASAQTLPLRLPQFIEPPGSNGADAVLYPNGILYNPTLGCIAGASAGVWPCLATRQEVAATYMPTATANAAIASMTSSINTNSSSISTLSGRIDAVESQVVAAQSAAASAATSAATAQTAANAAQAASTANASAITALTTRVGAAESAIAALQSMPKRLCASFTVAAGLSVPLTGISSVQNVPLTGVPVGAVCDTGAPSRMPLGARPDPVVTTAGTVNMAFVSNAGLLSSVISIPSGTYKVCCDSF